MAHDCIDTPNKKYLQLLVNVCSNYLMSRIVQELLERSKMYLYICIMYISDTSDIS